MTNLQQGYDYNFNSWIHLDTLLTISFSYFQAIVDRQRTNSQKDAETTVN